jgi:hypothetical protein
MHNPIRFEKLDTVSVQRAMIHLGLHCRRARLHRPLFLQRDKNGPRYPQSHEICLQSAKDTVSISLAIIESSLNVDLGRPANVELHAASERAHPGWTLSVHRLGTLVNHMFMACAILAFHSGAVPSPTSNQMQGHGDSAADTPTPDGVRDQLAQACRGLTALGAESPVVAGLVRNLVGLLRRYQVQGVDSAEILRRLGDSGRVPDQSRAPPESGEGSLSPAIDTVSLGLDGLWDDFVLGSSDDYYTHLFANLDSYCGTA